MGFELFTAKKTSSKEPCVTILKSGNLFINSAGYEKFLSDVKCVNLMFDVKNKIIGIQPSDKAYKYSYKVTKNSKRTGGAISARSFCAHYGIDYSKGPVTYTALWNDRDRLIEVRLDDRNKVNTK